VPEEVGTVICLFRQDAGEENKMEKSYFIVVFAHSMHGRLRRVHIPHQAIYLVLGLALLGCFSLFGFVSSYLRMTWKVANYNSLRQEVDSLRTRYAQLQHRAKQSDQQLASLQMLASEVTLAYGIKQKLEGPDDIAPEGKLAPSMKETFAQYNFLKSATLATHYRFSQWLAAERMPNLWPVKGRLQSPFGTREDPFNGLAAFHSGVDISAMTGTPVMAAADGIVTHADWSGGYGKLVVIDHGNGLQTYYGHLSGFQVLAGQEVRRGEVVAYSGSTGRSTSPHLHYEIRISGNPVNPYPHLNAIGVNALATPGEKSSLLPF
jgi:murein DD-endopeptidase MepM/ murein hydrolase activator NlpD